MKAYIRSAGKSGLARLVIIYKNMKIPTGVKIPPASWNHTKQKVMVTFPEYKKANDRLTKKKAEIIKALEYFEVNGIEFTKEGFKEYLYSKGTIIVKPKNMYSVADLLRRYARDNALTKKKGYLRKYETIAKNLDAYHPGILAAEFGMRQWNKLVDYLIDDKELENNTIHDYARKIRLAMQTYLSQGVTVHPDYKDFKYKYIDPKPFWLDCDKIELLEQFEPMEGQRVYLQEFLFRCYTGLRWSDVHQLKEENIIRKGQDVYIDFTVVKTKLDQNLLLSSKAVEILKLWKWEVPKLYLSDCNEQIKLICKAAFKKHEKMIQKVRFSGSQRKVLMIPEWKMVTTHVARRSFATHWIALGGSIEGLRNYLGHSTTIQTEKYVGIHAKEVNDELRKLMG